MSFTKLYNQNGHRRIDRVYGSFPEGRKSRHIRWLGGTWSGVDGVASSLYDVELEDVWQQNYAGLDYRWQLNDLVSLNPGVHYYETTDSGDALLEHLQCPFRGRRGLSDAHRGVLDGQRQPPFRLHQLGRQHLPQQLVAVFGLQRPQRVVLEAAICL